MATLTPAEDESGHTFETSPEVELHEGLVDDLPAAKPSKDSEEGLDETSIKPGWAQTKFAASSLQASANFPGLIGDPQSGYTATEFATGARGQETLEQKHQRLQHEVKEFLSEVESAKAALSGSGGEPVSSVALASQVQYLQSQLQQLKLNQLLGDNASATDIPGRQADLTRRLIGEIENFKSKGISASGSQASLGGDSSMVTYELFYRPEQAKFQHLAKAAELERRVQTLEKIVGADNLEALAGALNTPDISLQSAMTALNTRVQAVSDENLADLDKRLQVVLSQLDAVKAKQATEQSEYAETVNELYETTKRWDAVASSVPDVVERLQTLKTLHEQGAEFGKTLGHLEAVQSQIKDQLISQTASLGTVEKSFKENLDTIETNFQSLDRRIANISGKLEQLS